MTQSKTHQSELERLEALEKKAEMGGGPESCRASSQQRQIDGAQASGPAVRSGQFC